MCSSLSPARYVQGESGAMKDPRAPIGDVVTCYGTGLMLLSPVAASLRELM
jgi:hypothetical protein